jgi:hypothetical protein
MDREAIADAFTTVDGVGDARAAELVDVLEAVLDADDDGDVDVDDLYDTLETTYSVLTDHHRSQYHRLSMAAGYVEEAISKLGK